MIHYNAIIPTCGRRNLLGRALQSAANQERSYDRIIVIDDSGADDFNWIDEIARVAGIKVEILSNRRTKGLSGALNTGIDHLERTSNDPTSVYVSFLDDDDYWDTSYLARTFEATLYGPDFIAGTIRRIEKTFPTGKLTAPPERLEVDDFLIGNPGVQGSNLTARLSCLLMAGMFDEALPSCTDRDLCIRLLDINATYASAKNAIVHHDTLHGDERLSDPGSHSKIRGLDHFFAKWRLRMRPETEKQFRQRAYTLFGWQETTVQAPAQKIQTTAPVAIDADTKLDLIVGIIVDGRRPERCLPLIDGLSQMSRSPRVGLFDVVLLENGLNDGFEQVVDHAITLGLSVWPVRITDQQEAIPVHLLQASDVTRNKPIAVSRSLLQQFTFQISSIRNDTPVWILDDDFRMTDYPHDLISRMMSCRRAGMDIVIGGNTGSAPVPASSVLRTQMIDFVHMLLWAGRQNPDMKAPAPHSINARWRQRGGDYHYDLTRSGTHNLETPFLPELDGDCLSDVIEALVSQFGRILAGNGITRPILAEPVTSPEEARTCLLRGGNTLIFKTALLRDVPNMSPRVGARNIRRSDMIWAADCLYRYKSRVEAFPLPMVHDRSDEAMDQDDRQRLIDDIIGYGFFRAYEETLSQSEPGLTNGRLTVEQLTQLKIRADKYIQERLAAYRLSFWRVIGLARTLEHLISTSPWWLPKENTIERKHFSSAFDQLKSMVDLDRLKYVERAVNEALSSDCFDSFVTDLEEYYAQASAPDNNGLKNWCCKGREEHARQLVSKNLNYTINTCLGMGGEGVVLLSNDVVIKVFDRWSAETRTVAQPKLCELVGKDTGGTLPDVVAIHSWREACAVEYRYEKSCSYEGGNGPLLVEMLQRLNRLGLVHTNISPENLRITSKGIQLIDIGKSLEPATPEGQDLMVRRAFISWRFHYRQDIKALMRRSLKSENIPELTGWQVLKEAIKAEPPKRVLDCTIMERIQARKPSTVIDFGCGKPRLDVMPDHITAYDTDVSLKARWLRDAPGAEFWSDKDLKTAISIERRFDAVICSLVLCAVDDMTLCQILESIRNLVESEGRVIVAICDPGSVHVEHTLEQVRIDVKDIDPAVPTSYRKRIRNTGNIREEFHRPLSVYRRDFSRAGFRIENEEVVDGFDLERLERVPEFRIFELSPLQKLGTRTALLIKLCAMESETALYQVRHLEHQLAHPRGFDEVVLLIDPFQGPFPREHSRGDLNRLRVIADRLVSEGVADRIIEGFEDGDEVARATIEWTGQISRHAHCINGQPAVSILAAINSLDAEYVLHADADVLIARPNPGHDHILETVEYFLTNPDVLTLALPVYGQCGASAARTDSNDNPFRVEALCGWIATRRLRSLKPLTGELAENRLKLPWHKMVDLAVRAEKYSSVRKGNTGLWFTAVDNLRKHDPQNLFLIMDRIESGNVPSVQAGQPLAAGTLSDWLEPRRSEEMVLVVCGRNVRPGTINRCITSLLSQSYQGWGAIFIDDSSDEPAKDALQRSIGSLTSRVTYLQRKGRAGLLPNTYLAIRNLIEAPDTIVVLLDLDDALASPDALQMVLDHHREGADVTVGSMLRTDKHVRYPVDFVAPRDKRGGNVWQHLRSFRKSLFDRIPPEDLKLDGAWIDLATDWAFMLPIAEMAKQPVYINDVIYFHEPSNSPRPADEIRERERIVSHIVARTPMSRRVNLPPSVSILCYHRFIPDGVPQGIDSLFHKRGMAVRKSTLKQQLKQIVSSFNPVRLEDLLSAWRGDTSLPENSLLITVDDGYRDFVDIALPEFQKAGIQPVLFTRLAQDDGFPDWAPLDMFYIAMGQRNNRLEILNADWLQWRENLLTLPFAEQLERVEEYTGVNLDELTGFRQSLYLSDNELQAIDGVNLGAHGVSHIRWPNLGDDELYDQLVRCRNWLDHIGSARIVAYPDGACDDRVISCLEDMGFEAGFTIQNQCTEKSSRFSFERLIVPDDKNFPTPVVSKKSETAA